MKILCKIRAYYNGEIIKPGQIVDISGDTVPCWGKPVNNRKPVEQKKQTPEVTGNETTDENETENNPPVDNANGEQTPEVTPQEVQELANKPESELVAILEELRTQALEKNIIVDAENKSIIEQINELKIKLNEENK